MDNAINNAVKSIFCFFKSSFFPTRLRGRILGPDRSVAWLLSVFLVFGANGLEEARAASPDAKIVKSMRVGGVEYSVAVELLGLDDKVLPKVPMGKLLKARVLLTPSKELSKLRATLTRFDAWMPSHNHGMVTKAVVKPLSNNSWQIQGLKFHMSGEWELKLFFEQDKEKIVIPIPIKV